MADPFLNTPYARNHPAPGVMAVTPDDNNDLANVANYFRVGTTAGDVEVVSRRGDTVIVPNVQIGEIVPGEILRIKAANTTAVGITAWYY